LEEAVYRMEVQEVSGLCAIKKQTPIRGNLGSLAVMAEQEVVDLVPLSRGSAP